MVGSQRRLHPPLPAANHGPTCNASGGASPLVVSPCMPFPVSQIGHSRTPGTPQGRQQAHRSNMARVVPSIHQPPLVGGGAPRDLREHPSWSRGMALGTSHWPPRVQAGWCRGGHLSGVPHRGAAQFLPFLAYPDSWLLQLLQLLLLFLPTRPMHPQGHTRRRGPPKAWPAPGPM